MHLVVLYACDADGIKIASDGLDSILYEYILQMDEWYILIELLWISIFILLPLGSKPHVHGLFEPNSNLLFGVPGES